MKLSCLPVSLFQDITSGTIGVGQWGAIAKECGYDGFDISNMFVKNHTQTGLRQLKEEIDRVGIPLVMMTTYPDFTNPDPLERSRQMDYFACDMAVASYLGASYVRMTAGMIHEGVSIESGVKNAIPCIIESAKTAKKYGIELVLENHAKPGAWDRIDFTFEPQAFLALVDEIEKQNIDVGINFDTANAVACGADAISMLERVAPILRTVHINDTMSNQKFEPCAVGKGKCDFDAIFEILKKHNFTGWICIEEAGMNGTKGIAYAHNFIRALGEKYKL